MKRLLALSIAIFAVVMLSAEIYPIIFLGGGMSNASGRINETEGLSESEGVFALNGGLAVDFDVLDSIYGQSMPLFPEIGARYSLTGARYVTDSEMAYDDMFQYIDALVKFKVDMRRTNSFPLVCSVGYVAGFLVSATRNLDYGTEGSGTVDIKEYSENVVHHTLMGMEYWMYDSVFIGLEMDVTMSDIYKDSKVSLFSMYLNAGMKF